MSNWEPPPDPDWPDRDRRGHEHDDAANPEAPHEQPSGYQGQQGYDPLGGYEAGPGDRRYEQRTGYEAGTGYGQEYRWVPGYDGASRYDGDSGYDGVSGYDGTSEQDRASGYAGASGFDPGPGSDPGAGYRQEAGYDPLTSYPPPADRGYGSARDYRGGPGADPGYASGPDRGYDQPFAAEPQAGVGEGGFPAGHYPGEHTEPMAPVSGDFDPRPGPPAFADGDADGDGDRGGDQGDGDGLGVPPGGYARDQPSPPGGLNLPFQFQPEPGDEAEEPGPRKPGRAGRDLRAAIGVGVALGALILLSLYVYPVAFVGLAAAAIVIAVWELCNALATRGIRAPLVPLLVGSVAMLVGAYAGGAEALAVAAALTVLAVMMWRLADGPDGYLRDMTAGVFAALYVPFLAGFAVLMLLAHHGNRWVTVFILVTVFSDIGGYAVGASLGRHPMAPAISPKKSWEGFAGSVLACTLVGAASVMVLLGGAWWQGVVLGAASVATATLGDLAESVIKRDLGIKDMGSILPGHGGIMDRLDSLLPTAPIAWLLLSVFLPS